MTKKQLAKKKEHENELPFERKRELIELAIRLAAEMEDLSYKERKFVKACFSNLVDFYAGRDDYDDGY